jgi:hypothetical protein
MVSLPGTAAGSTDVSVGGRGELERERRERGTGNREPGTGNEEGQRTGNEALAVLGVPWIFVTYLLDGSRLLVLGVLRGAS